MLLRFTHQTARYLLIFGVAVMLLAGVVFAPKAQAENQPGNLVIFGDSVIADPDLGSYVSNFVSDSAASSTSSTVSSGCPTSPNNYGVQAAHTLGLQASDYSCSGTSSAGSGSLVFGPHFALQVDRALAGNALTSETERVLVTTGFNDTYSFERSQGQEVHDFFLDTMAPQIQRIRDAAPNARIQIVGYSTITDRDHVCLVNLGGGVRDRTYVPMIGRWEQESQNMQRNLAEITGTEFLDLKPSTTDRSMCAPDHLRNWAGIVDLNVIPHNLPFHMNARGHEHVADFIVRS